MKRKSTEIADTSRNYTSDIEPKHIFPKSFFIIALVASF